MKAFGRINKGVAVFVLAFLCLNVGGALCLTMCTSLFAAATSMASDSHLSEHCRQAKKAAEERERDSTKLEAAEITCCMIPVAMFVAPVEKKSAFSITLTPIDSTVEAHEFVAPVLSPSVAANSLPVYRPPPLDRRGERVLHSVFRI